MGKWEEEGKAFVGRIGFQTSAMAELWDEEANDFREHARPLGLTSPFAIDPVEMRVAFQLRGKEIQANSFTGALQALLNEASQGDRWRVSRDTRQVPLEAWAESVDRVRTVLLTLRRPNPHYGSRQTIRDLIEGTNAGTVQFAAHAEVNDPQGIDLSDPLVKEGIEHAHQNYGEVRITGETNGEQSQWTSEDDSASEIRVAEADPDTHEVSGRSLRHELGDPTAEKEDIDEARASVDEYKASIEHNESEEFGMLDEDDDQN
ncbi:MAG: hypothetical protein QOE75_777 [Solirubrobacterales bacterium]|jgi:hypothetical protein|nr:hypothetical protein [Solirubrobacterales bacterium]